MIAPYAALGRDEASGEPRRAEKGAEIGMGQA